MFASVSSNGYLHVVSGSKLDPSQLRKAIKTAMLVDWYNAGIIEFEIRASKEMLWKSSTKLFIKLVKETELSDFEVERRFMMEMRLRENKEAQLYFRVPKPLFSGGREERRVLDILTNMMNLELVDMGYLKEVEGDHEEGNMDHVDRVGDITQVDKQAIVLPLRGMAIGLSEQKDKRCPQQAKPKAYNTLQA